MKKVMSLVLLMILALSVSFAPRSSAQPEPAGGCKTKACQENCRDICGSDQVCYAACVRAGDTSQIAESAVRAAVVAAARV